MAKNEERGETSKKELKDTEKAVEALREGGAAGGAQLAQASKQADSGCVKLQTSVVPSGASASACGRLCGR